MSAGLLAQSQAERGHKVVAMCGSPALVEVREQQNGVTVIRVPHHNLFWHEDFRSQSKIKIAASKIMEGINFRYAAAFSKIMCEFKPDIVHTHSLVALTPLIWREARKNGARVVHSVRDYDLMCTRSTRVRAGQFCESRCWSCKVLTSTKSSHDRNVDAVVGISSDVLHRHLAEGYFPHVPQAHRHVVSNSVERAADFQFKARNGPLKFGYIGRISPEKGLHILISACRQLDPGSWELSIAGKPPEDLDTVLPDRGNGMAVRWLGWMDSTAFLDRIDVLVMPSIWPEPFGRVTVEAFSRGVPVLGSRIGGTPELIGTDNPEWLFDPNDVTALANAMRRIITHGRPLSIPRQRIADVLAATEPDRVARAYLNIYRHVLE